MNWKRRVFDTISDGVIAAARLNRPIRLYRAFAERIDAVKRVEVNGTAITFDANDELHLLRAGWIHAKEPETIEWIDSFAAGDVLYDIGANVGVFSLYGALHRACDVYAFEPEAKNYACLNRNILLNRLGRRVKALNVGLHDSTRIEFLQLHDLASGAALHALGEPIDWKGERFEAKFEQAVLAFGLDELVERFALPLPHHIKLDVDGNEDRIIRGGRRTFSHPRLESVLVEINEAESAVRELLQSCGLTLASSTGPERAGGYNAIFTRA
jgi:FkbM family methyltransferase